MMILITGNKVKKTHTPRYCEQEKDKANIKTSACPSRQDASPGQQKFIAIYLILFGSR
jgi:hypothetical protein